MESTPPAPIKKEGEQPHEVTSAAPHTYFNGFNLGIGTGDVTLVLRLNNQPVGVLNCSFTVAKTLSEFIGRGIQQLEQDSGRKILTTEDIGRLAAAKRSA